MSHRPPYLFSLFSWCASWLILCRLCRIASLLARELHYFWPDQALKICVADAHALGVCPHWKHNRVVFSQTLINIHWEAVQIPKYGQRPNLAVRECGRELIFCCQPELMHAKSRGCFGIVD